MNMAKRVAVWLAATLALAAAAQTAPYAPSPSIAGIRWDDSSTIVRLAPGSDNWPTTWGADGHLYTCWGDGNGFGEVRRGLGVARLEGEPDSFKGVNLWGIEEGGFLGSTNLFFANIPTKWTSPDGNTLYLIFTGYGSDPIARDAYQHVRGVLQPRRSLDPRPSE